jgi:hypothetical protein
MISWKYRMMKREEEIRLSWVGGANAVSDEEGRRPVWHVTFDM